MKAVAIGARTRRPAEDPADDLAGKLSERIIGQPGAIRTIVPYIQIFQAGLAPEGRPAGIFLLLGPTGTGKTRTVEALAEILHGSPKSLLRVDCGEFQMEHEVAKLVGAPPGYLGHRETQPMLTQLKLSAVASERSNLSVVLFDEIEKAALSLNRLLLGILDKATLRLGDNSVVNFERSIIFMTSNLGAKSMIRELIPDFGFQSAAPRAERNVTRKLESIAMHAVRKRFSPEFINRIDAVVTYEPLEAEDLEQILEQQLSDFQEHLINRLGPRAFRLEVPPNSRRFLLERGTSREYGARELKRTLHRHVTQPLANMLAEGQIEPGSRVRLDLDGREQTLAAQAG